MAKKDKEKQTKVEKTPVAKDRKAVAPPVMTSSVATAMDPYVSARLRMEKLPTVGEYLSSERVQGTFSHLLLMSTRELQERLRSPGISILELQIIKLLMRTLRDLPPEKEPDLDDNGEQKTDPATGKPAMRIKRLHRDGLQNEKQALDNMKYLHERAFGKTPLNIVHSGPGGGPVMFDSASILRAMDTLPKTVIDILVKKPKDQKVK